MQTRARPAQTAGKKTESTSQKPAIENPARTSRSLRRSPALIYPQPTRTGLPRPTGTGLWRSYDARSWAALGGPAQSPARTRSKQPVFALGLFLVRQVSPSVCPLLPLQFPISNLKSYSLPPHLSPSTELLSRGFAKQPLAKHRPQSPVSFVPFVGFVEVEHHAGRNLLGLDNLRIIEPQNSPCRRPKSGQTARAEGSLL